MQRTLGRAVLQGFLLHRGNLKAARRPLNCPAQFYGSVPKPQGRGQCVCTSTSRAEEITAPSELAQKPSRDSGSIRVIIGPMFAGKTKELLRSIDHYKGQGVQTLVVKSDKDDRYDKQRLSTHDGHTRDCFAVSQLSHLRERFGAAYKSCQVIVIDEAQFFPDLFDFCCNAADEDEKTVIVAGLNGDFRRQRFGQIMDLIPHADDVLHIPADCAYCRAAGSPQAAHFTVRIAADDRQEVVGGAEKYAPVCRKHYNVFSGIRGAALGSQQHSAEANL